MLIGEYEVPDQCPKDCRYQNDMYQGSMCHRCPIFNCGLSTDEDGDFRLLEPIEYRNDWAEEWVAFFNEDIIPKLYL